MFFDDVDLVAAGLRRSDTCCTRERAIHVWWCIFSKLFYEFCTNLNSTIGDLVWAYLLAYIRCFETVQPEHPPERSPCSNPHRGVLELSYGSSEFQSHSRPFTHAFAIISVRFLFFLLLLFLLFTHSRFMLNPHLPTTLVHIDDW